MQDVKLTDQFAGHEIAVLQGMKMTELNSRTQKSAQAANV